MDSWFVDITPRNVKNSFRWITHLINHHQPNFSLHYVFSNTAWQSIKQNNFLFCQMSIRRNKTYLEEKREKDKDKTKIPLIYCIRKLYTRIHPDCAKYILVQCTSIIVNVYANTFIFWLRVYGTNTNDNKHAQTLHM